MAFSTVGSWVTSTITNPVLGTIGGAIYGLHHRLVGDIRASDIVSRSLLEKFSIASTVASQGATFLSTSLRYVPGTIGSLVAICLAKNWISSPHPSQSKRARMMAVAATVALSIFPWAIEASGCAPAWAKFGDLSTAITQGMALWYGAKAAALYGHKTVSWLVTAGAVGLSSISFAYFSEQVYGYTKTSDTILNVFTGFAALGTSLLIAKGVSWIFSSSVKLDVINRLKYPANGVVADDGNGTYTAQTVKDAKLTEIIQFLKSFELQYAFGNHPGDGQVFAQDYKNLLIDQAHVFVESACADLVGSPQVTEEKIEFLKALVPLCRKDLVDQYDKDHANWDAGRYEVFHDKIALYDILIRELPVLEAIINVNFVPISHDHGVYNPEHLVTLVYDGERHASATQQQAQCHLDVHQTIDDMMQNCGGWGLDALHFDTMESARAKTAQIYTALSVELSGTGLFALTKCITIAGEPYALMIQTGDAACGIIGHDGKLRPLMKGSPKILSDQVKGKANSNEGFVDRYGLFCAAIVRVKPGEEIISFSDGIGEFLTPQVFQDVLDNNRDRRLLGAELRTMVMHRGNGVAGSVANTPDVLGTPTTKTWFGLDKDYYDDTTLILQVVPDKI